MYYQWEKGNPPNSKTLEIFCKYDPSENENIYFHKYWALTFK